MKITPIDTTSDAIKARLIFVAKTTGRDVTEQANHKLTACHVALDIMGIEDQKLRDEFQKIWDCLPTAFACNSSAMNKALEFPTGKVKLEKTFSIAKFAPEPPAKA